MSVRLIADVLEKVHDVTSGQKLLLICLANYANDRGECWPSISSLAAQADVTPRHVSGMLHDLAKLGYVTIREQSGKSNSYTIQVAQPTNHSSGVPTKQGAPLNPASPLNCGSGDPRTPVHPPTNRSSGVPTNPSSSKPSLGTVIEPSGEPSVGADAPKPLPDNGPIQKIVKAWYERAGVEPANYAKALGYAKQLHAARVTPRELSEMYDWYAADPWRVERGFDLGSCVADIEKFRQSQRLPKPASNGRASPVKETTLERNIRNLHAAFDDEPEPSYDNVYETKGFVRQ